MDPITASIVTALAAGAAAAAKDVATDAIKSAYATLKDLISTHYQPALPSVEDVEADPTSLPEQEVLAKKLDRVGAAQNEELKAAAKSLIEAIETLQSEPRAAALFDFGRLSVAKNFKISNVDALGAVLRAQVLTAGGDVEISDIHQKPSTGSSTKN